jgi:hypothetical protein
MPYRWDPPYPRHRFDLYRAMWDPGPGGAGRRAGRADAHLRASDAERNEVAERLARHFADGRLDQAEYRARLDRAMGATTRGDLGGLFDDLPPLVDESPPPSRRRRVVPVLVVLALFALTTALAVPFVHVPVLLIVVIVLFLWYRSGRRHPR